MPFGSVPKAYDKQVDTAGKIWTQAKIVFFSGVFVAYCHFSARNLLVIWCFASIAKGYHKEGPKGHRWKKEPEKAFL